MSQAAARPNQRPSSLDLLHRACQRVDDLFLANVSVRDITPRQFAVLRMLAAMKDVSQTDISDATGIDRSTLADIVRRLVKKKLVDRKRTKTDARMYAVRLTDAGRKALADASAAARSADTGILAPLSVAEREAFLQLLGRVVAGKASPRSDKKIRALSLSSSRVRHE